MNSCFIITEFPSWLLGSGLMTACVDLMLQTVKELQKLLYMQLVAQHTQLMSLCQVTSCSVYGALKADTHCTACALCTHTPLLETQTCLSTHLLSGPGRVFSSELELCDSTSFRQQAVSDSCRGGRENKTSDKLKQDQSVFEGSRAGTHRAH